MRGGSIRNTRYAYVLAEEWVDGVVDTNAQRQHTLCDLAFARLGRSVVVKCRRRP